MMIIFNGLNFRSSDALFKLTLNICHEEPLDDKITIGLFLFVYC